MRELGIGALILTILSFFLWLLSWSYYTFLVYSFGTNDLMSYVARTCSFLSSFLEFVALALISISLIMGAKYLMKSGNPNNFNQS